MIDRPYTIQQTTEVNVKILVGGPLDVTKMGVVWTIMVYVPPQSQTCSFAYGLALVLLMQQRDDYT